MVSILTTQDSVLENEVSNGQYTDHLGFSDRFQEIARYFCLTKFFRLSIFEEDFWEPVIA